MVNHHKLLDVPELLLAIFSHLRGADRTRFLLLRRSTWNIAIGELWKEARDVWNLMAILPADVTVVGSPPNKVKVEKDVRLSRQLNKKEWERFYMYSQHIRTLVFMDGKMALNSSRKPLFASRQLWLLSSYKGAQPLLPVLQHVSLTITSPSTLLACVAIFEQELHTISLKLAISPKDASGSPVASFLAKTMDRIVRHATKLEAVHLDLGYTVYRDSEKDEMRVRLVAFVQQLRREAPNLKALSLEHVPGTTEVMSCLGQYHVLEQVTLRLNDQTLGKKVTSPRRAFSSLKRLHIKKDWNASVDAFLIVSTISSVSLESLTIDFGSTAEQLARLVQHVSTKWANTLTEFTWIGDQGRNLYDTDVRVKPIRWSYIQSITQCVRLEKCHIRLPGPANLTDQHIRCLVQALPWLRVLRLSSGVHYPWFEFKPETSLHALHVIAAGLRDLEDLSLDINIGDSSIKDNTIQNAANPRITEFASQVVGGPATRLCVEDRLRLLFPMLQHLTVTEEDDVAQTVAGSAVTP